jgi:hypothetical protein
MSDDDRIHDYAGGEVSTRAGRVNHWLLLVYAILALWAAYYLVTYWGGLGPGRGDKPNRAERLLVALALLNLAVLLGEVLYTIVGSLLGP